jgi:hypothetical protein
MEGCSDLLRDLHEPCLGRRNEVNDFAGVPGSMALPKADAGQERLPEAGVGVE